MPEKRLIRATLGAAALSAGLVLLGGMLPAAAGFCAVCWMIPLALLIAREGEVWGLGATAAVLVWIVSSPGTAPWGLLLPYGGAGIWYGISLRRSWKPGLGVGGGLLIALLSMFGLLALSFGSYAQFLSETARLMEQGIMEAAAFYQQTGMWEQLAAQGVSEAEFQQQMLQAADTIARIYPALLGWGAMIGAALTCLLIYLLAPRLGIIRERWPGFSSWQLPWHLTWVVILGLGGYLAGDYWGRPELSLLGSNLLVLLAPLILIGGIALATWFFRRSRAPVLIKLGLAIVAGVFFQYTMLLFMGLGLFDPLINYRKRALEKGGAE